MKQTKLFKSLLVAVALLVGASAWAGTQILYSQNYESATDASSWVTQNLAPTLVTGDATYGNYISMNVGNNNSRSTYTVWGSNFYGNYNTYTLEFDANFTVLTNNTRNQTSNFAIMADGYTLPNANYGYESKYLFKIASTPNTTTFTINDTESATFTMPVGVWCHYTVVVDGTANTATYTITNKNDNSEVAKGTYNIPEGTSYKAVGMYYLSGRYWSVGMFDNISITTEVAGDVANDPSIVMTGVKGENREYTITFDEGETLHYTVPGGTEQTTTTSPLVLTITEAGTLSAYTTKGSVTSSTVEATVTHGAITLNAPVFTVIGMAEAEDGFFYPQVSFSSDNSSLEGAPTATYDVSSPYTFTAKGDLTVTASADGYTSSSATYSAKKYQLSKTIDFGALTADDFDASVWESATGAPRDYWTNRAAKIPADVTYYKLIDPSLETAGTALAGITISNASIQDPEVYIGYGLLTQYYQGRSGNMNFTVNDATSLDYAVYDGWNNYGSGTFSTIQAGNANFALYRYDTMLRTIKVYSGDYSFGIVGDLTGGWDTDVEMTQDKDDKNVYTLVVDKFTATAGTTYEYKLRTDGKWGGYELPASGNNDYYFENGGVYKLTFTANIKANTLTLAVEENPDYTLVGLVDIFGTEWDLNNTDNDMIKGENGEYSKTYNNVTLPADYTIKYKVVKNHDWSVNWGMPSNQDGNAEYWVENAGTYDITFYFNPATPYAQNIYVACEVTAVPSTVSKTITAAGYATYCSPYALDFTESGLTAYIANLEGSTVKFTEVTSVPAKTGVLLKGSEGDYTIKTTTGGPLGAIQNLLVGVLEDTQVTAGSFVLMNGTKGVGFYKTTAESFTVGANTAYIPATTSARTFIGFDFDNTTTAIEGVATVKANSGEIYNLQGQRVTKATKGLYIVNGKKVMVK